MDKNAVKTILCERLNLAKIPFQRQGNQIQTAAGCIQFQAEALVLKKPGKAERQLPYHKVRISQLLWQLHEQPPAELSTSAAINTAKAAHKVQPNTFLQA
ncbi:hypothetical protein [Rheinheimera sp.]|uniref:hypothetical protein n=1 Tax=Rheinheimera sp. TaxID=1869214 RepID=UPI0027BA48B8|nr:hypothetical protein [Rheinheimera sp.]